MGKAEDGASIVALVPFIAEKGRGLGGFRDRQMNLQMCGSYADLTAVSRVHSLSICFLSPLGCCVLL